MPVVYYGAPAGLTLSLVRSETPEGDTTTASLAATSRAGVYKASDEDAAAGDTASVLLGGNPVDVGKLSRIDGDLWFVPMARTSTPAAYPVQSVINDGPVEPQCLKAYRRAAITHSITVTNPDGSLPDLSGKTLVFVASTLKRVEVIYAETVTVEGDDNNEIVVELDGEAHDLAAGEYRYGVWEGEYPTGRVWAHGEYMIEDVGGPHIADE